MNAIDQKSLLDDLKTYLRDLVDSKLSPKNQSVCLAEHFKILLNEIDKRYEERFNALQQSTSNAFTAANMITEKAEQQAEKWRENANEWRAAMADKDRMFSTRAEYDLLARRVDELETVRDITHGKASQTSVLFVAAVSIIGLLLSIMDFFIK